MIFKYINGKLREMAKNNYKGELENEKGINRNDGSNYDDIHWLQ